MDKISDLKVREGNVNVEGMITGIGDVKTFNKFGRELRVVNAVLENDSGRINLSLWNDDVDNFKVGDKIKVINGYVNEFNDEKQLTSGKFGKVEKVEEESSEEPEEAEESSEEEETSEESEEETSEEPEPEEEVAEEETPKESEEEKSTEEEVTEKKPKKKKKKKKEKAAEEDY